MKIIIKHLLLSLLLLCLLLTIVTSYSSKNKNRKNRKTHHKNRFSSKLKIYDPSYSPAVIVDYLRENFDDSKDKEKLLTNCLNFVTEGNRIERQRQDLWVHLEKFAMDTTGRVKLDPAELREFLKSINAEASIVGTPQKVSCSFYLLDCLKPQTVLTSEIFTRKIKNMLQNGMGIYTNMNRNKSSNNLVTSFASYHRDNGLRTQDLFSRLNGKTF